MRRAKGSLQWSNYDHMRLKGSLPDAFAVAEVPKHEIRSPHDWLFPPGISSRTDSYNPLTGTPDRLTFFTWTRTYRACDGIAFSAPRGLLLTDVLLVGEVDAVGLLEL